MTDLHTKYGKVAVLMGGTSAERDVSLNSGKAVLTALQDQGVDAVGIDAGKNIAQQLVAQKIDRAFNVLHGRGGEDGAIQGCLDWLNIPYTGTGLRASAITMDKQLTKDIWIKAGLPVADSVIVDNETQLPQVLEQIGLPLVIKPTSEGSSFGISIVKEESTLLNAWKNAKQYGVVMAEQYIDGIEYTVAILGEEVLPAIKLKPANEFYDYDAKYLQDDTQYICPCGLAEEVEATIAKDCKKAFEVTGCKDWGRVDVIYDGKIAYLIEVNTVPGMTSHSLVPMAAKATGMSFAKLVLDVLDKSLC